MRQVAGVFPSLTLLQVRNVPGPGNADSEIIQIGAGFAGLRCADVLSQKGLKVTILEGRNRIGGRVSGLSRQTILGLMKAGPPTISSRSRIRFVCFDAAQVTTILLTSTEDPTG